MLETFFVTMIGALALTAYWSYSLEVRFLINVQGILSFPCLFRFKFSVECMSQPVPIIIVILRL